MWVVFCDQYWERIGIHEFDFCFTDHWQGSSAKFAYQTGWLKNDRHPSLRTHQIFILQPWVIWQHQCLVGYGPALQQYLAIYKMVTVLLLVAPWSLTLSGLIQGNICVMAYLFAACADWLVGCSRHPVSFFWRSRWGFRFTVLCASVCVIRNTDCVLLFAPRCWLISVPVVVRNTCLSLKACSCPMCLCTVSRIDRNPFAVSWFVCATPTSMGSSSITWCSFFRSSSFSKATSVAVSRVLACTVLNRWPAKALSVNSFRKLTTLPSSPIAHAVG